MFTHNYKNRFELTQADSNILMSQIRAEKKIYSSKQSGQPQSHRDDASRGKRIYNEMLYRPSLSPSAKENRTCNFGKQQRGRRMHVETPREAQDGSRSGKKRFDNSYKKQLEIKASV
jgi:hypothetical protein